MSIPQFLKHMNKSVVELMDDMDKTGKYDERFNLKIEWNGKQLDLDMHADLYNRLERFLEEEEEENNL